MLEGTAETTGDLAVGTHIVVTTINGIYEAPVVQDAILDSVPKQTSP